MAVQAVELRQASSIERLLSLSRKGVELWVHCGALCCHDPQGVMSPEDFKLLQVAQRELLAQLLDLPSDEDEVELTQASAEKIAPLTFQQEFALRYVGENFLGAYAVRLTGALDLDALARSVNEVVRRHEALRTNVVVVGGSLKQRVLPFSERSLEIEELGTDQDVKMRLRGMLHRWVASASRSFDVKLLKLGASEHVLLVAWDHLFSDHQSGITLFRELWRLYRCLAEGQAVIASERTVQYSDYALWQRSEYSRWLRAHGPYWDQKLKGSVALRLPVDSENRGTPRYSEKSHSLGHEAAAAIREISNRTGVTVPLVVLSVTAMAFSMWSGQREFVLPYMFAGRYHSRHLQALGYYPTPLMIRIEITPGKTHSDLIKEISREFFSDLSHLDIGKPLDGGVRERLQSGLVQWFPAVPDTGVQLTPPASDWDVKRTGLAIEPFGFGWGCPMRPLITIMSLFWSDGGDIAGICGYRSDLYSDSAVDRYIADVARAAMRIASDR